MGILKITELDTIVGDGFAETTVNTFFENLERNIGEKYAVYYEKEKTRFKIIYEGITWYLMFEKKVIEDYEFGAFNYYTKRLKELIEKTDLYNRTKEEQLAIKKRDQQQKVDAALEKQRLQQVFKAAEQGVLPKSYEDLEAYLTHLKKGQKFSITKSITKIAEYFSDFGWHFSEIAYEKAGDIEGCILGISLILSTVIIIVDAILLIGTAIPIFLLPSSLELLGGQLFVNKMAKIMLWILSGCAVTLLPWEIIIGMTFVSLKKEHKEYKRLINQKITRLEQLLRGYSPLKKLNETQVELYPNLQVAIESCEIKDRILLEFYKLQHMAGYLNDIDKTRLEKEILEQVAAYESEKRGIQQEDLKNELSWRRSQYNLKSAEDMLSSKTQFGLDLKYMEIIVGLEAEICAIRKRDIETRQLEKDLSYLGGKQDNDPNKPAHSYRHISGYHHYDTNKVYNPNLNNPKTVAVLKRVRQKNK